MSIQITCDNPEIHSGVDVFVKLSKNAIVVEIDERRSAITLSKLDTYRDLEDGSSSFCDFECAKSLIESTLKKWSD
jgi:hypothetical protein